MTQLFERDSGRGFDVEQRQSEVDQLKAQLEGAKWNLDKTVVRAPADGYVDQYRPAQGRAGRQPAAGAGDGLHRYVRYAHRRRNRADRCPLYSSRASPSRSTFKFRPGKIYSGKVESILQAVATGQVQASGLAVTPKDVVSVPFVVRIRLDDADFARRLPAGSTGDAAIFTEHVKVGPRHPKSAAAADCDH